MESKLDKIQKIGLTVHDEPFGTRSYEGVIHIRQFQPRLYGDPNGSCSFPHPPHPEEGARKIGSLGVGGGDWQSSCVSPGTIDGMAEDAAFYLAISGFTPEQASAFTSYVHFPIGDPEVDSAYDNGRFSLLDARQFTEEEFAFFKERLVSYLTTPSSSSRLSDRIEREQKAIAQGIKNLEGCLSEGIAIQWRD